MVDIIESISSGNIFTLLNIFGSNFNFKDNEKEEVSDYNDSATKQNIRALNSSNEKESRCKMHKVFYKNGLSCESWNNLKKFIFQFLLFAILVLIVKVLACLFTREKYNKVSNEQD